MDNEMERLLEIFELEEVVTSSQIASYIHLSEKTVRKRVRQLNDELTIHGAKLHAVPGKGYYLEVFDNDKYQQFKLRKDRNNIPTTSIGRVVYILSYLLSTMDYVKLEELSQCLYVSRNTITADVKQVECILEIYHLKIIRRPNYGIKIEGSEFNCRRCIANYIYKNSMTNAVNDVQRRNGQAIAEIMKLIAKKYHMNMMEQVFETLIVFIVISNERIQKGFNLGYQPKNRIEIRQLAGQHVLDATDELAAMLFEQLGVQYNEDERLYLALHLCGKSSMDGQGKYGNNLVISSQIDEMVLKMLDTVFESTGLDFRDNLELRMSLNQHMVPLDIRLRYNISLKNPLLEQVKREYAFAYNIALCACTVLTLQYGKPIPEDEVGYLAVLFALVMSKRDKIARKYNIVVVCASGRGTSQMFMLRYKQAFGKYINKIYESSVFELDELDFEAKKIDFVFTTVALDRVLRVPVFEVSLLLNEHEISNYQKLFEKGDVSFLNDYFSDNLFINHLSASNKEDALRKLCEFTALHRQVPDDFYDLVMKREAMGQTDFGNLVAVPHPYHILGGDKFVSVGILEQPVWWGNHDVQVIFLVSLLEDDDTIEQFYRTITNFLSDISLVNSVVQVPEYKNLINHLITACHR